MAAQILHAGSQKDQEYIDFLACYEMLIALINDEAETLTTVQESDLYTIALKHSTRASGMAEIMLVDYAGYLIDEVLVDPESSQKSARVWDSRKPKLSTNPSLRIFPNPATDHVVIEFRNWGEQVDLRITDALGRVVRNELISAGKTSYIVDLSELRPGTYTFLMQSLNGSLIEQEQVEVTR